MNIAIPKGGGKFHLFTNEGLAVGDKVYPLVWGWNDGKTFYVFEIETNPNFTGWPDEPHTILNLAHSKDKSYQVRTDHGYSPIEVYFKLIN